MNNNTDNTVPITEEDYDDVNIATSAAVETAPTTMLNNNEDLNDSINNENNDGMVVVDVVESSYDEDEANDKDSSVFKDERDSSFFQEESSRKRSRDSKSDNKNKSSKNNNNNNKNGKSNDPLYKNRNYYYNLMNQVCASDDEDSDDDNRGPRRRGHQRQSQQHHHHHQHHQHQHHQHHHQPHHHHHHHPNDSAYNNNNNNNNNHNTANDDDEGSSLSSNSDFDYDDPEAIQRQYDLQNQRQQQYINRHYQSRQKEKERKSKQRRQHNINAAIISLSNDEASWNGSGDELSYPSLYGRRVYFSTVNVREYDITIGDNPSCQMGAPLSLDWGYTELEPVHIDIFEASRPPKRSRRGLLLNYYKRRDMLWRLGFSMGEIKSATRRVDYDRWRRSCTLFFQPIYKIEEAIIFNGTKIQSKIQDEIIHPNETEKDRFEKRVRKQHSSDGSISRGSGHGDSSSNTPTAEGKPKKRIRSALKSESSISSGSEERRQKRKRKKKQQQKQKTNEESDNTSNGSGIRSSIKRTISWRKREGSLNLSSFSSGAADSDNDVLSLMSTNDRYTVRIDRTQGYKATQVVLCNMKRPHMRAFHFSWMSFFIAFFTWFSVTPLLGEIQTSLHLSNEEIWISNLCGSCSTIFMRIIMGPLCDKFGARVCMATILLLSAIPCALTGLVETSTGLYTVRSFIGIAGASFVACQYWTSMMFTREVVGTANALVAGWGNLGGGVTQVMVGSVLFPLFVLFFPNNPSSHDIGAFDDNNSTYGNSTYYNSNSTYTELDYGIVTREERAWRLVFIVPAVLSIVMALCICFYSDDSPKGKYRELIRNQEMEAVNPTDSLIVAMENRNTWILTIQYACCFGVEVTMTNAVALYFRQEFDQSTVAAAAIASVFGFMNLFARGFGGAMSDIFHARFSFSLNHNLGIADDIDDDESDDVSSDGMSAVGSNSIKGRLYWQIITLFVEGGSVIIFAYAKSLIGAIFALIFTSIMVQCAEGSTFGIVPYIDRRRTGSIVGWVGAGGTVGGVVFALFFYFYGNERGFLLMGVTSSFSSLLSLFVNSKNIVPSFQHSVKENPKNPIRRI